MHIRWWETDGWPQRVTDGEDGHAGGDEYRPPATPVGEREVYAGTGAAEAEGGDEDIRVYKIFCLGRTRCSVVIGTS